MLEIGGIEKQVKEEVGRKNGRLDYWGMVAVVVTVVVTRLSWKGGGVD